ncbi:MAG: hypothetical protein M3Q97_07080 [Bacteroidota bacterium]|nr:hypothetical protein [Bacteroidota bacterium]
MEFYNSGTQSSPTVDDNISKHFGGGLQLTEAEKSDLVAFLKSLSDSSFLTNPDFENPF